MFSDFSISRFQRALVPLLLCVFGQLACALWTSLFLQFRDHGVGLTGVTTEGSEALGAAGLVPFL